MYKKKKKIYLTTKQLPKVFTSFKIPKTIETSLLELGAFTGDYQKFTHSSQQPYLLGFKNDYSFYDFNKSILLLGNALRFLKKASLQPNTKFIFAGTPFGEDQQSKIYIKILRVNHAFFLNEQWDPGFISKQSPATNSVLIVYDINLNNTAYQEGVKAQIPVVGFVTPSCDLRGLDYPILLNLNNNIIWYIKLILALFYKK